MDFLTWARSPWGEDILAHISWDLLWASLFAGVAFLVAHASYMTLSRHRKRHAAETDAMEAARTDLPPRAWPKEPPPAVARSLTLADARVEMPLVQRSYLVPSFANAQTGVSEALEVLAHILGTGANSRLYQALVVQKKIAVSAGAWYDSSALGLSKFGFYGAPVPGTSLTDLETAIEGVIAELADKGVTATELERSKTRLVADAVYASDSQAGMARWYGTALTTGATVQDVGRWPDRIKAVTAEQVRDAARQWLDKKRSVTGYLIKDTSPQVEKRT